MYVELGALIHKAHTELVLEGLANHPSVVVAFVAGGRSNDLFQDRQFGQFGEASIITMIVQNKFKDEVMQSLAKHLDVLNSQNGLIFEEKSVDAFKSFS